MSTDLTEPVFMGVDTHADTHHVAVVDSLGRHLDDLEFPTIPGWIPQHVGLGAFRWIGGSCWCRRN